MLRIVFIFILVCLSVVGIAEIIKVILISFLPQTKGSEEFAVLIPNDEDIEYAVRSFAERNNWNSASKNIPKVVINNGLSTESEKICEKLVEEYSELIFLSKDEFIKIF